MCEILALRSNRLIRFPVLLELALDLERKGVAGFGWGVAWVEGGRVRRYRNQGALAGDEDGRASLEGVSSPSFLVHLRRPSRLSTVQMADTQPFVDERETWAWCHNGLFANDAEHRDRFAGRLQGRADSEVAFRIFEELLEHASVDEALPQVHRILGGRANLAYLDDRGDVVLYGGNSGNAFWTFKLDGLSAAATGIHSHDMSLFDLVFSAATDRHLIGEEAVRLPVG